MVCGGDRNSISKLMNKSGLHFVVIFWELNALLEVVNNIQELLTTLVDESLYFRRVYKWPKGNKLTPNFLLDESDMDHHED